MGETVFIGLSLLAGFIIAIWWAFKADTSSFDKSLDSFLSSEPPVRKDARKLRDAQFKKMRDRVNPANPHSSFQANRRLNKANERMHKNRK
ncbi:hypothetical protein ACNO5E_13410 [Vibrio parahaemolyticus]|uniref:hypothetical protein n=1 Tax=Vibrio parahaemolyticus TaxID=670 RepID=UPI000813C627|nr:hypothetical protein [Vibrio parahaemolyticus]OCP68244.1 hypothetical protein AKH08_15620 [Vibrio parahaemolyticus]